MSLEVPITASDRWFRGERKDFIFNIIDGAGAALNVTGFALKWVVENFSGEDVIVKETGDGIVIDGAQVTVAVEAADTKDLVPRVYRHALKRTDSGSEQVLAEGPALLRRAAEKDAA